MNPPDTVNQQIAGQSDCAPYTSNAFFYSSPGHLRAAAHLYGVETEPLEKARVLELGCGSGGNLLPFVLAYSGAQAVGVDLSPAQIQQGRKVVQDLGVENLQLHAMSLAGIDKSFGEFDYIIVHSVFSWVPLEVRQAILRICSENLSPKGIAYISYHTYPGWKAGETVRDAMLLHSHSATDDEEKLASARTMLTLLSDGVAVHNPQAAELKSAVEQLHRYADYYSTAQEYLEAFSSPSYFLDFAGLAQEAGLAYVGDAEPQEELSASYGVNVQLNHSLIAFGQPKVMRQQYLDFAVGRQLRKSLLVRQERAEGIRIGPDLARFADLRWAGGFRRANPEPGVSVKGTIYITHTGRKIMVGEPLEISIVEALSYAWPASLSFQSLVLNTADVTSLPGEEHDHSKAVQRTLEVLFKAGLLRYSFGPSPYDTVAPGNLHLVPGLASLSQPGKEAAYGVARFNLWHDGVDFKLNDIETALLPAFNGQNNFPQIVALLRKILQADGMPTQDTEKNAVDAKARLMATRLVDVLKRQGALMGASAAWVDYFTMALEVNAGQGYNGLGYLDPLILYASPLKQGGLSSDKSGLSTQIQKASGRRALPAGQSPAQETIQRISRLQQQELFPEAESLARQLTVQFPRHMFGWHALSQVLSQTGRTQEGLEPLFKAIALQPMEAGLYSDLCAALLSLKLVVEAEISARRALRLDPHDASVWNHLGNIFRQQKRISEAEACYRRAIREKPDYWAVYSNLGNACAEQLRVDEAMMLYRKVLDAQPDNFRVFSNWLFIMTHDESAGPIELFKAHRSFALKAEEKAGAAPITMHANSRDPGRLLRVGFVSGDLRAHAVAHFLEPVWRSLDKKLFEIYAYSTCSDLEDDTSLNLRRYAKEWTLAAGLSDAALAQQIRRDGIDILFDLSGHTGYNRLPMFTLKPAPVQASWIGYPATTGLDAMDYYLVDKHFAPPGMLDDQFTEKLVRLPLAVAFEPVAGSPDVNELPVLGAGRFTFGSFNRLSKVSEGVFALWARVLDAVPGSQLLLGNMQGESMCRDIAARFEKHGIGAERLVFRDRTSIQEYLRLHHEVDLLLDTFPYTGGTTTYHGLWMGIPTLTLAGQTLPGRQGVALMSQFGLNDFVAGTQDEYVDKALAWSMKRPELAALRTDIRGRIERSSSSAKGLVTQGLEAALRQMWQCWCDGRPPESFEVQE
ncbi:O-linked N-acetylglucosamine transferase family protein [Paralcaligenes ginsengisoli]